MQWGKKPELNETELAWSKMRAHEEAMAIRSWGGSVPIAARTE